MRENSYGLESLALKKRAGVVRYTTMRAVPETIELLSQALPGLLFLAAYNRQE